MSQDSSDRMPDNGFILPLFPAGWLPRPDNATQICAALDQGLERVRADLDALHAAHSVGAATGQDLDAVVALLGLRRLAGETDAQLRARGPATVQHGVSASARADMALYLTKATGLPATVTDWSTGTPGFDATVVGNNGLLGAIPGLIRAVKALGIPFRAYAVIGSQSGGGGGLGEFGLGEQGVGSADDRVFLGS